MSLMDYIRRMNVERFDLNLLRVLDALLTERAVGHAAARLGLSQPAASHALRRLRALLNDPLLVRVGSRMELTPRALGLREPVSEALAAARKLFEGMEFDPATSRRRFVLMAPDIVVSLMAPALTEAVLREAPNVCVEITPWRGPHLITEDFLRKLDAIVTNLGDSFPGFHRSTLYRDTDVLVVRRNHPVGKRLRTVDAFLKARHVAIVGRGSSSDQIDDWLTTLGMRRNSAIVAPSYLQALHIAAETDLVAFVPSRLAELLADRLNLMTVKPPFDPGIDEQFLFYPATAQHDQGSLWFRSLLMKISKPGRPEGSRR
ncbi:LysR family transcriptional regulator [Bradyrhizobium ivorense]|nr:LysR family transcriptional regulator [Bradyrhizobium ivorense]